MSDQSKIEWTDATWNPTTGCTKISPGCAHCYIERTPAFRIPGRKFVKGSTDLRLHHDRLNQPRHWRKPRRVFVNSLSDLFHPDVPFDFVDAVMVEIAHAVHCDFQVLTKRADPMRAYFSDPELRRRIDRAGLIRNPVIGARGKIPPTHVRSWPFGNLWLGVSVENQHFADERIPLLLQTPAAIRFISAEPLLGRVELVPYLRADVPSGPLSGLEFCPRCGSGPRQKADTVECPDCGYPWSGPRLLDLAPGQPTRTVLDWVIVGGESGNGARPFEVAWARSIVAQCKTAGVACFVKQLGADARDAGAERDDMGARDVWPAGWMPKIDGRRVWRPDLTSRKGGEISEWPLDLRVREFPSSVREDLGQLE